MCQTESSHSIGTETVLSKLVKSARTKKLKILKKAENITKCVQANIGREITRTETCLKKDDTKNKTIKTKKVQTGFRSEHEDGTPSHNKNERSESITVSFTNGTGRSSDSFLTEKLHPANENLIQGNCDKEDQDGLNKTSGIQAFPCGSVEPETNDKAHLHDPLQESVGKLSNVNATKVDNCQVDEPGISERTAECHSSYTPDAHSQSVKSYNVCAVTSLIPCTKVTTSGNCSEHEFPVGEAAVSNRTVEFQINHMQDIGAQSTESCDASAGAISPFLSAKAEEPGDCLQGGNQGSETDGFGTSCLQGLDSQRTILKRFSTETNKMGTNIRSVTLTKQYRKRLHSYRNHVEENAFGHMNKSRNQLHVPTISSAKNDSGQKSYKVLDNQAKYSGIESVSDNKTDSTDNDTDTEGEICDFLKYKCSDYITEYTNILKENIEKCIQLPQQAIRLYQNTHKKKMKTFNSKMSTEMLIFLKEAEKYNKEVSRILLELQHREIQKLVYICELYKKFQHDIDLSQDLNNGLESSISNNRRTLPRDKITRLLLDDEHGNGTAYKDGIPLWCLHEMIRGEEGQNENKITNAYENLVQFLFDRGSSNSLHNRTGVLENGNEREYLEDIQLFGQFLKGDSSVHVLLKKYDNQTASDVDDLSKQPQYRLVVVQAEVFETAMRQYETETVELTFSNYFPRNCRMFIGIPVYREGFINRQDKKDRCGSEDKT